MSMSFAQLAAEHPPLPHPPEPAVAPTWAELTVNEPRLIDVERHAMQSRPTTEFYELKAIFAQLVGFDAERYELRTSAAYNAVYDHIFETHERSDSRVIRALRKKPRTLQGIVRVLIYRKVARDIGREACLLLCYIAAEPQPVCIADRCLALAMNCQSFDHLHELRDLLVNSGMLTFKATPRATEYEITIPPEREDGQRS
jgi:hypothetical protein